jgi:hypothetical protein
MKSARIRLEATSRWSSSIWTSAYRSPYLSEVGDLAVASDVQGLAVCYFSGSVRVFSSRREDERLSSTSTSARSRNPVGSRRALSACLPAIAREMAQVRVCEHADIGAGRNKRKSSRPKLTALSAFGCCVWLNSIDGLSERNSVFADDHCYPLSLVRIVLRPVEDEPGSKMALVRVLEVVQHRRG